MTDPNQVDPYLPISNQRLANANVDDQGFPDEVPLLPLRGIVVYPFTVVPLTIGQPRSLRLVEDLPDSKRYLALVAGRDPDLELPGPDELYSIGTLASVQRLFRAPDGTIRMIVRGLRRIEVDAITTQEPYLKARIQSRPENLTLGIELEAQVRAAKDQFEKVVQLTTALPQEILANVLMLDDPLQVAYAVANYQHIEFEIAQQILELDAVLEKLQRLNSILGREVEVLSLGQQIQHEARSEIERVQRDFYLREQLKVIQKELGEKDEQSVEVESFHQKIAQAGMPEEANQQALHELERWARMPAAAAESSLIRTYLDWLLALPWQTTGQTTIDLEQARQILNQDHYGLEDVKERILEFLAVRNLRQKRKQLLDAQAEDRIRQPREGMIVCFVGPPGVGKTSLGRSIARATNRPFVRISLGGVHDEAEIRGHRRTYVGAMPGRILQAIRRCSARNPVFMLDEVDKLGRDFRGDPAAALLEVLDAEQNQAFRDHYLEVAFDLSQVLFLTTANRTDTIPPALLDRMELIWISGYTQREKINIANTYLIPRQTKENGLQRSELEFSKTALAEIILSYTREAGVRGLERAIDRICRKAAMQIALGKAQQLSIDPGLARSMLGKAQFRGPEADMERTALSGVVTGLAWTPAGGEVLLIEAAAMPGEKAFHLTGSLGDVMRESAQAAQSFVRSQSAALEIAADYWQCHDIHLHIPSGATPKDGPSAGITMAIALASMASGRKVRGDVGMSGEITLRGRVLPVGGVKEKVLAAHRAALNVVILPRANEADLDDVPLEVRNEIEFVLVDSLDQALAVALEDENEALERRQSAADTIGVPAELDHAS